MANMDLFDAYFRRADLDHDGRISGAEAVGFFQGANLPKQVLAQIWMHADQNHIGFLGRAEFYNALKLVTVAQSGRQLTPDIVKAALFGPAASKIPAPQIAAVPAATAPAPVVQSTGFRGPHVQPSLGPAQQYAPPASNQFSRPVPTQTTSMSNPSPAGSLARPLSAQTTSMSIPLPAGSLGLPGVGATVQRPQISGGSTDWPGSRIGGPTSVGPTSAATSAQNHQIRGSASLPSGQANFGQVGLFPQGGSFSSVPPKPLQESVRPGVPAGASISKGISVGGNGFSSGSIFGGDVFSAAPQPKQPASQPSYSVNKFSSSMALVSTSSAPTPASQPSYSVNNFSSSMALVPTSSGLTEQSQPESTTIAPLSLGAATAASGLGGNTPLPWPRMTESNVKKYTKVFSEVDTDRDGKITGEQARDLFLSWRLPREVLKQVWDLSDQDGDSMLSLREFCIALYLMERYREGRPLPSVLPAGIQVDEAMKSVPEVQSAGQRSVGFNGIPWQQNPVMAPRSAVPGTVPANMLGQLPSPPSDAVNTGQSVQQKSKVPVLEMNFVSQLTRDEQDILKSKQKDAEEAERKAQELEKDIMDSKEKIEYYRSKLQEIVLYKTRCDNRINEIAERAAADKREVESLSKKYEEKYKQTGDSNSRLATEERAFRDLQERKMELYNAIVRMEQGGTADGLLQVRADRIQADLEELRKALNERCKQFGLRSKPSALIELPYGWQPGIQENAAEWDDDWDKFEDEGFTAVQDLMNEGTAPKIPAKTSSDLAWDESSPRENGLDHSSSANEDNKAENISSTTGHHATGSGSSYAHSEDGSVKSGFGSPQSRSGAESPREFSAVGKSSLEDGSAGTKETQSNDHHATSSNSGDAFGDGGSWAAAFNTGNDEHDPFWGFDKNAIDTKSSSNISSPAVVFDGDRERQLDHPTFDSGESFKLKLRIPSPRSSGDIEEVGNENYDAFGPLPTKGKPFFSFDSVPSTPLFSTGSPGRLSNAGSIDDRSSHFDSFVKFDSFNKRDSGSLFDSHDSFARFDSMSTTNDAGHTRGFTFDDNDPFASAGPFSLEGQTPKHTSDSWSAF
uniref:TSA: Wollemia nobilis Ref_Wollemi_Transcript_9796_3856 transcribed RNA sequence n=1 Tax=Wollemia nobilis TaxID=56998 RepID=A0A0C9QU05_9CONI